MADSKSWRQDAIAVSYLMGHHSYIAERIEAMGFEVELNPDDNEKSYVVRPGNEDTGARIIGEIVGDAQSFVRIWIYE